MIVLAWFLGAAFVLWWPLLFHLQRKMEDRLVREDEALDALFVRILDDLPRGAHRAEARELGWLK